MFKSNKEIFVLNKILDMKTENVFGIKKYYTEYAFFKQVGNVGNNRRIIKKFIDMGVLVPNDGKYCIDIESISEHWKESQYPQIHKKIQKLNPFF